MFSHFPSLSSDVLVVTPFAQYQRDLVYAMAKANDIVGLENYVQNGGSIDVKFQDKNAVALLASEGHEEAVMLLVKKFHANKNDALYGAAIGAQHENGLIEALIDLGAETNYAIQGAAEDNNVEMVELLKANGGALLNAIEGAARNNHHELLASLVSDCDVPMYNVRLMRFRMKEEEIELSQIRGYAYAGNQEKVNELLSQYLYYKEVIREPGISAAISGAGLGGHLTWMYQLLAAHPDSSHRDAAVRVLAMNGDTERVLALIAQGASRDCAAEGASFAGHTTLLKQLIKDGASIHQAASWAAQGGQYQLTLALIKGYVSLQHAIMGAAQCVHLDLLNDLIHIARTLLPSQKMDTIIAQVKNSFTQHFGAMQFSSRRRNLILHTRVNIDGVILRLITFINDKALREALQQQDQPTVIERNRHVHVNRHNAAFKKLKKLVIDNAADSPKMIKMKNVDRLNRIMVEYQLPLSDAVTFKSIPVEVHVWFLLGPRLVNEGILQPDVFLLISMHVLQKDCPTTKSLFMFHNKIMPAHLFALSVQKAEQSHGNNNNNNAEADTAAIALAEQRFKQRLLSFK